MSTGSPPPTPPQTDGVAETLSPSDSQPVILPDVEPTRLGAPSPAASGTAVIQFIGGYAVLKKIGEGGMGSVYLAEDPKLSRKVAIKTMKPELAADKANRDRFEREAKAAAAVEHENIVPIWGIGEAADGSPFIAMPFLQGEMLADRLRRQPVAGLSLLLKVAREVAEGLAAAHAKGLIHRDIKPGNIWLEGDPNAKEPSQQLRRCKILDFGLARSVKNEDAQLTASGAILGTPAFMSPEQALGENVDHRADLFSLGVTLYRMATGKLPFNGQTPLAVMIALTTETPLPVWSLNPNLPPTVAELIDRLLNRDPAGRPQSAAEVSATVRQVVKELQGKPSASSTSVPTAPASQPAAPVAAPPPARQWQEVTEAELVSAPKAPRPKPKAQPEPDPPRRTRPPKAKASKQAKRSRLPWFIAGGVLGLCAIVALAVVILRVETSEGTLVVEIDDPNVEARVKNGKLVLVGADGKDKYTITAADKNKKIATGAYSIRVEGADGLVLDTHEFTLKKGEKVTVRVTLDPKIAAKKPDPPKRAAANLETDRKAAEWVLSIGGSVAVDDQNTDIKAAKDLPKGAFRLTTVDLNNNQRATDAGLACLKDCSDLTRIELFNTPVGDVGLDHLKNCKNLMLLNLCYTKLTDSGLAHFKDHTKLIHVEIAGTQATDAGAAHFAGCKGMLLFNLNDTKATEASLTTIKNFPALLQLYLSGVPITDAGLVHVQALTDLHLIELKTTKVSAKGIADLVQSLPRCKIIWDKGTIEPNFNADRKAAEYVLSIGGSVGVDDRDTDIKAAKDLPKGAFRLTKVELNFNQRATDAGLACFLNCKDLSHLNLLQAVNVTDAGMVHFARCKNLTFLRLGDTSVTDAGLAHFKNCKNLMLLDLYLMPITNAGLMNFKDCKNLLFINLGSNSKITDAGLEIFKDCKNLAHLHLFYSSEVTDAGFALFAGHKEMLSVNLGGTKVTDAGLAVLKNFPHLTELRLEGAQIGDAGLAHAQGCAELRIVQLAKTKITAKGIGELKKALPGARIEWDGGTIEPGGNAAIDRKAAEWVLSVGGTVCVDDDMKELKVATELPPRPFQLRKIRLVGNAKVTAAGMACFTDCKNLTELYLIDIPVPDSGLALFKDRKTLTALVLSGEQVRDAGLANLKGCTNLTYIALLQCPKVTDAGLANFKGCTNLNQLHMAATAATDAGLACFQGCTKLAILQLDNAKFGDAGFGHFKDRTSLSMLSLVGTGLTDTGLAHFKDCKKLEYLNLSSTAVTDAGLAQLVGLDKLTELNLTKTKVTAKGIEGLVKALPKCKIEWGGGVIEPKK